MLASVLSLISGVFSVYWASSRFTTEELGGWLLIQSVFSLLPTLDLGVGNVLLNCSARAKARGQQRQLQWCFDQAVVAGMTIGFVQAVLIFVAFTIATAMSWMIVPLPFYLSVVVVAIFLPALLLMATLQRVLSGAGLTVYANRAIGIGQLAVPPVLLILGFDQVSFLQLVVVTLGVPTLLSLFLTIAAARQKEGLRWTGVPRAIAFLPHLLRRGKHFFSLQITGVLGWGLDTMILAQMSGLYAVAIYGVFQRYFQTAFQPVALLMTPLWAELGVMKARGEIGTERKIFVRALIIVAGVGGVLALASTVAHSWILQIWTHGKVMPDTGLACLLATWLLVQNLGACVSSRLNAHGLVREQLPAAFLFLMLALLGKVLATPLWGAAGLVGAMLSAYLLVIPLAYQRIWRQMEKNS
jgi:O-antigen/teichoic acid export membrane protein